jgi:hypothetical protein
MKKYKFEIDIDNDGVFTIEVAHGKKLNRFSFKGRITLLEDEEALFKRLESDLRAVVTHLMLSEVITDYSINGNLGASK